MVNKKTVSSQPSEPKPLIQTGGKDIIGQKPLIKKVNNNFLYGAGLLLLLGGGYVLMSNPKLLSMIGLGPKGPPASVTAQPAPSGAPVNIQGMFNPPVPQAFYSVTNQQGQQVAQGSLGSNVSQYSQAIPGLSDGTYTVTVSDQQIGPSTVGPQGPGQTFPTSGSLQQGLTQYTPGAQPTLGAAQSGPESIALT